VGKKIPDPPKVFNVNWFRTDESGNFIWPGFGDNMRVLIWALDRCDGKLDAVETPIGYEPLPEDINIESLEDITLETVKGLLDVDKELWQEEIKGIHEFYSKFGEKLPQELNLQLEALKKRLDK